ncbi:MAG: hypothetical protein IJP86_00265 [Synergistaceae bacterium]|nr:hypothetical protein [Synergistaceae bacterium]
MALGKRRNELRMNRNVRGVLSFYTDSFLDKNMYVCLALANVFYALCDLRGGNAGDIVLVKGA